VKVRVFRAKPDIYGRTIADSPWCALMLTQHVDENESKWFPTWTEAMRAATAAPQPQRVPRQWVRMTDERLAEMHRLLDDGWKIPAVARELGVSVGSVYGHRARLQAAA
jgi:DNA-binding NarL/FixJ family response regulator